MKLWITILIILIVLFESIFFENIATQMMFLFNTKGIYISAYYTLVSFIGFLSMAFFILIKEKIYFFLAISLLLITYAIELIYKNINGVGFSLNDLSIVLNEGDAFALDALSAYASSIWNAMFILMFVLVVLLYIRKFIKRHKSFMAKRYVLSFFLLSVLLSYSILYRTTGGTETRPTSIKIINTATYYMANKLYYGKREELKQKATLPVKYNNIVFIVDESIGGQYLSINGYKKETTPYLKTIQEHFINLGLASSGANCSASSNLILMSGIQLNNLPDKEQQSLKKATIFQYAKNAGYKTHYISGQGVGMRLQNHMTQHDLKYIDNFTQLSTAYKHHSIPEEEIVLKTKVALDSNEKNFIFIVKHGAHFQWEDAYPKEERYFLPALEASDALSFGKKREALNSYLNSIKYTVDLFFKHFLEEINFFEREDTLLIYTADHGQSILEEGRSSTHCDSSNPPLSQGLVPLLLFTAKEDSQLRRFNFTKNSYNHYQLFPTIQKLMGYENIEAKTLFDKADGQIFVSGDIFGRVFLQKNNINLKKN